MHKGILQSNSTVIAFVQRILDITIIVGCLWVAVALQEIPWLLQHTTASLLAVFLFHFTSELDKLYISWRGLSIYKELKKLREIKLGPVQLQKAKQQLIGQLL